MKRHIFVFGLLALFCTLHISCAITPSLDEEITLGPNTIKVPSTQTWTKTDISIQQGQYMHVVAQGKVQIEKASYFGHDYEYVVGPQGTYDFSKKTEKMHWEYPQEPFIKFPLPAAVAGPAPCYALIGKVGEHGDIFLLGRDAVVEAKNSGTLYLGINDFNVEDNTGDFYAKVDLYNTLPWEFVTKDTRKIEEGKGKDGTPVDDARVLIIYLDGIDYDVLTEMAYKGYLPNIKKLFFDNGINFPYTFTVYPSTTWTSTACFLSSSFSDLTGIKSDVFLDRRVSKEKHFFTPYGPLTAARRMYPDFVDHVVDENPRRQELPTIFNRTHDNDVRTVSSVLPVLFNPIPMANHIPTWYINSLTNSVRYLGTHQTKDRFDRINTNFSLDYVIKNQNRVMYVWLPGVDAKCHETPRGQWGAARKPMYLIDKRIGELIDKLKLEGIYDKTYIVLYSDHGHMGGKDFINQRFDVANDFFYKSIVDEDGDGELDEDSGLGFNIEYTQHDERLNRAHIDRSMEDFMAVGSMGYGAAVIYLPYKHKYSRNFKQNNSYYDLTHYQVHPTIKPVNIINRLFEVDYSEQNKFPNVVANKPIDMVIIPVTKDRDTSLVINNQGLQALIEMRPTGKGKRDFEYRYRVVTDFDQDENGNNTFNTVEMITPAGTTGAAAEDPLHYTSSPSFMKYISKNPLWFNEFHSGREWLEATKETEYPDAVVTFAHFTKWDESINNLEERFAPDFAVSPKKGWNFQTDDRLATDHGYPLFDSMRVPLFITGPNIKKGVVNTTPHRILDVAPTALKMVGGKFDESELDGKSILDIYEEEEEAEDGPIFVRDERVAFYTDDGLPIEYPLPVAKQGTNIHNIDDPYDLHYMVADVVSLFDLNDIRIVDDIFDVFIPGRPVRPINTAMTAVATDFRSENPNNLFVVRTTQFFDALRIKQFDIRDTIAMGIFGFYFTENNFWRANLLIDWIQDVGGDFNRLLGAPFFHGERGLLPGQVINVPVDFTQLLAQNVVKIGKEAITRLGYRSIFVVEKGINDISNATKPKVWQTPEIVGPKEDSPFRMLDVSQ